MYSGSSALSLQFPTLLEEKEQNNKDVKIKTTGHFMVPLCKLILISNLKTIAGINIRERFIVLLKIKIFVL
jgi:hypothetical protein